MKARVVVTDNKSLKCIQNAPKNVPYYPEFIFYIYFNDICSLYGKFNEELSQHDTKNKWLAG